MVPIHFTFQACAGLRSSHFPPPPPQCSLTYSISYLHNSHQPIVAIGISQDGKSTCWVSSGHSVHRIPRRRVGLIFICYRQICYDHIHPVFRYFAVELQKNQENILPRLQKHTRAMPYWTFINIREHISLHRSSDNLSNKVYLRPPRNLMVWFPCQLLPFGLSRIPYLRDIYSAHISILPAGTLLNKS